MAQLTSAAAFVEGGVQDACDDACSICLETFCENDPATITSCKHEYHLQCILEWSQRSKECPMCWQPLSLKDPASQALLTASEQERMIHHQRSSPFYHRARDDGEFHRFGMFYGEDSDLEDRIMQHLAAAAMGRAEQFSRVGDALRFRPSPGHGHPHFMILPAHSNQSPSSLSPAAVSPADAVSPLTSTPVSGLADVQGNAEQTPTPGRASSARTHSNLETGTGNIAGSRSMDSALTSRHRAVESSDGQRGTPSSEPTFTESFKSRMAAASSRCRESFSKTSRGFRERLRNRNTAMTDLSTRARDLSAGVVRLVERYSQEGPADAIQEGSANLNSRTSEQVDSPVLSRRSSSHSSDRGERQGGSSNSLADRAHACNLAASSVSNSPQPSVIETSRSMSGTPSKVG